MERKISLSFQINSADKLVLAEIANTIEDQTLKNFIADGQLNLRMPGFAKTLTSEQLDDVVAYIRTLKSR